MASRPTTVLFIDDDPTDLDLWSQRLKSCSTAYSILTAEDVESGLNVYKSQKVDCVILDLDLNHSSGFEVLLALVPDRHNPAIPVIVLTKINYRSLHEMVMHHGARACLVKSLTLAHDLHKAIQNAVAAQ